MPIPDPFTPAALRAGVLTNIASDLLKHHLHYLDSTLAARILKRTSLVEPGFDDCLHDTGQSPKPIFRDEPPVQTHRHYCLLPL